MSGPRKAPPVKESRITRVNFDEAEAGEIPVATKKPTEAELRESAQKLSSQVSGGGEKGGAIRLPKLKEVKIRGQSYEVLFLKQDAAVEKRMEALKQGWRQVNPRDVSVSGFIYTRPENNAIVTQFLDEGGSLSLW